MDSITTLCLAALGVLLLSGTSNAVTCYDCLSSSSGCGDPFNPNGFGVSTCNVTGAACAKAYVGKSVARGCVDSSPTGCGPVTVDGVKETICYCYSDLCNTGFSVAPAHLLTFVIVALLSKLAVLW